MVKVGQGANGKSGARKKGANGKSEAKERGKW